MFTPVTHHHPWHQGPSLQVAPNTPPLGKAYDQRQCCGGPLESLEWMFKTHSAPSVGLMGGRVMSVVLPCSQADIPFQQCCRTCCRRLSHVCCACIMSLPHW